MSEAPSRPPPAASFLPVDSKRHQQGNSPSDSEEREGGRAGHSEGTLGPSSSPPRPAAAGHAVAEVTAAPLQQPAPAPQSRPAAISSGNSGGKHPNVPRGPISASDVVAAGQNAQTLQLPSPVYCAEWIDDSHILIGAGGGGNRFGMLNVLVLLKINTAEPSPSPPQQAGQCANPEPLPPLWRFVQAVDLQGEVPWCSTSFLPYAAKAGSALHAKVGASGLDGALVGFIAVSSITTFSLIGVSRASGGGLRLRHLAKVTVPSDLKNPDKKPIALVRDALVVAHDDNGIHVYDLASLVPSCAAAASGALENGEGMIKEAEPVAEWGLTARVNGLHANRFQLVHAKPSKPSKGASHTPRAGGPSDQAVVPQHAALVLNYLVIAALVQDKTMRVGTFRLRRRHDRKDSGAGGSGRGAVAEGAVLSATETGLPFKVMGSSMRLVRVFALEDLSPAAQDAARRALALASLGQQTGSRVVVAPTSLASLLLVAYDTIGNQSYFASYDVQVQLSLRDSAGPTDSDRYDPLVVTVKASGPPAPVLKDGVTSISAIHGDCGSALTRQESHQHYKDTYGTSIPRYWLVGSIEGWVASVRLCSDLEQRGAKHPQPPQSPIFLMDQIRPSANKSVASRFPALHKEPISCVAVSSLNDVVTVDISQHVLISALPLAGTAGGGGHHEGDNDDCSSTSEKGKRGAIVAAPATCAKRRGIELFPEETGGRSMWLLSQPYRVLIFLVSIIVVFVAILMS